MKEKLDSKFFIVYTILESVSFLFTIVLFIIAISQIFKNASLGNEFFEIFYFAVHIIIHFLALALCFKAIKQQSFVIKPLTHNRYAQNQKSRGAVVVFSILLVVFASLLIYGILVYTNVGIYDFHFTSTLKLVMISVGAFMVVSLSSFILYPIIYK